MKPIGLWSPNLDLRTTVRDSSGQYFTKFDKPSNPVIGGPIQRMREDDCLLTFSAVGGGSWLMTIVLLVDDDPLQAHVRRSILQRQFRTVERATDAAEAFIMVEDPDFAERLGLVVVGLNRPGLGSPDFVAELISRLPAVPVLVLGHRDDAALYPGENVRFLPRAVPTDQMLAISRQMVDQYAPRVA